MYVQDYDERFPFTRFENSFTIYSVMYPYYKNWDILVCPSATTVAKRWLYTPGFGREEDWPGGDWVYLPLTYATNEEHYPYRSIYWSDRYRDFTTLKRPAEFGVFFERTDAGNCVYCPSCCEELWPGYDYGAPLSDRHNGGMNIAFADGHAKWLSKQEVAWGDNRDVLWGHVN